MNNRDQLERFIGLLRAKAIDLCKRSEGNDNRKGYFQAGKADGLGWAAEHLETLIKDMDLDQPTERCR